MINFRYTCVTLNLRQIAGDWGEKDDFHKGLEGRAEGNSRGFLSSAEAVILSHCSFHSWVQCWALHTPQAFSSLQLRKRRLRGWGSDHRCSENCREYVPIRSLHFCCCQEGTDNQTPPEEVERHKQLQAAGPA